MYRVKLRFFAKKRVKHYFLFFEKITLSTYNQTLMVFRDRLVRR